MFIYRSTNTGVGSTARAPRGGDIEDTARPLSLVADSAADS